MVFSRVFYTIALLACIASADAFPQSKVITREEENFYQLRGKICGRRYERFVDNLEKYYLGMVDDKKGFLRKTADVFGEMYPKTLGALAFTTLTDHNGNISSMYSTPSFLHLWNSITKILKSLKPSEAVSTLMDMHDELVEQSSAYTNLLPPEQRAAVELMDQAISSLPKILPGVSELQNIQVIDAIITMLRRRETILLCIPTEPKNAGHFEIDGDAEQKKKIDQAVNKLIQEQPEGQRRQLKTFISKIRYASVARVDSSSISRPQVFFHGAAGVGKTTFASNLAKTLGLPFCEISMTKIMQAAMRKSLLGMQSSVNIFDVGTSQIDDENLLGELASCIINSGVTNPILFIDEVDRIPPYMLSEFKILMDTDRRDIMINSLNMHLDFSRITVIFAGNKPLKDTALNSRIPIITFGALSTSEKRNAQLRAFNHTISQFGTLLGNELSTAIQKEGESYLETFILREDTKVYPGARAIQEVTIEFLYYLEMRITNGETVDREEAEKQIITLLEQRKPSEGQ